VLRVLLLGPYQVGTRLLYVIPACVVVPEGLVGCRHPLQVANGLSRNNNVIVAYS
jgi:hypothetical protein